MGYKNAVFEGVYGTPFVVRQKYHMTKLFRRPLPERLGHLDQFPDKDRGRPRAILFKRPTL